MKKIPLFLAVLLITAAIVVTFCATYVTITEKHNAALNELISSYSKYDKLIQLDEIVKSQYYGELDDTALQDGAVIGYLEATGDKYAAYMTAKEYDSYKDESNGSTVGIGVTAIYDAQSGYIEVLSVMPDSSAAEVGIRAGDLIVEVNGEDVAELGYYGAIAKIRGNVGESVVITISRNGEKHVFNCIRKTFSTSSITYHVYNDTSDIGVIRISEFNATTPEQFIDAVEALRELGCTNFVFDLRNNGGGELTSIVSILDYILPEGPIVHIYYADNDEQHITSDQERCMTGKFAVLVNENTASAAELFASALKDYASKDQIEATLVGTQTYGKGVLQSLFSFKDGSAVKFTTGRYDPPYSENYDGVGVLPDLVIDLSDEAKEISFFKLTDENDNQLTAAVEYLK